MVVDDDTNSNYKGIENGLDTPHVDKVTCSNYNGTFKKKQIIATTLVNTIINSQVFVYLVVIKLIIFECS